MGYKVEKIDVYILITKEETEEYQILFKDGNDIYRIVQIEKDIRDGFIESKKKYTSHKNEVTRHREQSVLYDGTLNKRARYKEVNIEDLIIQNEGERKIKMEIWKLPSPQNRRTYMKVVEGYSYTKIARIEHRTVGAIKRSVDAGIRRLRKNLKNF